MAEFSDSTVADQYWRDTKKRLQQDGFQLQENILKLKLKAKDGKMRLTEVADGPTCLRIIQSIPSEKAEPIRRWLAGLGYERIEEANNPELGINRAYDRAKRSYQRQGKDGKWIDDRFKTIDDYKLLCDRVSQICDKPIYSSMVNAEYLALFGEVAETLRVILDTKSIRDSLPKFQLAILHAAEVALLQLLEQSDRMTMLQITTAARRICEPLGDHMREVCTMLGVDLITGLPLLSGATPAGAARLTRNVRRLP